MKIGCDIVEVERFKKMHNLDAFLLKNFSQYEIEYINTKKEKRFETIAGIYAFKEATLKALNIGILNSVALCEVCLKHGTNGEPKVDFTPQIKGKLGELKLNEIEVSISHTKDNAMATVIIF